MAMDKSGVSSYRGSLRLGFLVDAGWRGGRRGTTRAFGIPGEGSGRIGGLAGLRDRGTSRFSRLFLLLPGSSLGLGGPYGEDDGLALGEDVSGGLAADDYAERGVRGRLRCRSRRRAGNARAKWYLLLAGSGFFPSGTRPAASSPECPQILRNKSSNGLLHETPGSGRTTSRGLSPVRARRLLSQRRNAVTIVFAHIWAPVFLLGTRDARASVLQSRVRSLAFARESGEGPGVL